MQRTENNKTILTKLAKIASKLANEDIARMDLEMHEVILRKIRKV